MIEVRELEALKVDVTVWVMIELEVLKIDVTDENYNGGGDV
jgi:hypothetical protein